MRSTIAIGSLLALVAAQAPPAPVLLTATKSGVLPYLPTPFSGVETIEGAITYDGPMNTTVTGKYHTLLTPVCEPLYPEAWPLQCPEANVLIHLLS